MRPEALILCVMLAVASLGATASDERHAAVEALGELNGVALQCKYLDQVRRLKAAVVDNAPKERSFGIAFDEATNRAFLAFIRDHAQCPGPTVMARQVDTGIEALRAAFAGQ